MKSRRILVAIAMATAAGAMAGPTAAGAQDFFSALFGGFNAPQRQQPYIRMPFADEAPAPRPAPRGDVTYRSGGSSSVAWCVRTCDGRYFPLGATGDQSKEATCNSFCPASKTEVVYGSSIDSAETDGGKSYSALPNAFKYRTEIVDGCTCNGKDHFGLAKVSIDNDPTLRKGDVVASDDGLKVANRSAGRKSAELNFSPAPAALRAKYERAPVLASE
ncbi:conserved exported protein of unknown function [Bradyrhizobium sp. ORS 285]|uniref:DUF2865 domain-containing protein n=1 Tax=Bradyrhizobium sp. ORS 285 TaxID=115808 RepID=UPI000240842B|nr:DUF2865 domain-containing protein [Bradyrhizobium sp. ORS 285]CCD86787.1 conserved exported hypothetical protein [Bradyrhizobium sp. ORS 285]SMX55863.1 conserved exported protein of unknown function [Bradyrhizobium sp. ORS 285]